MTQEKFTTFTEEDIRSFLPSLKIGILGTINQQGLPHLTMLSSLMASSPSQLCFGQFTEGLSKQHLRLNPQCGFLIMSLEKQVWRGTAHFSHTEKSGKDYDHYNNEPMFRYNAYFGVHTVYYLDLLEQSGRQALPMGKVVFGALLSMFARTFAQKLEAKSTDSAWIPPLANPWIVKLLNKLDTLKFLSYIDEQGYPAIIPCLQAQRLDRQHVIFSTPAYRSELQRIPAGCRLALFALSLSMEDVLLAGVYLGMRRFGGVLCGALSVDMVYNSMPPAPRQVYPPLPLKAWQAQSFDQG